MNSDVVRNESNISIPGSEIEMSSERSL